MARCCAAWDVNQVVLPAKWPLRRGARLGEHTLAAFQAHLRGVELLLVDADGRYHRIGGKAGKPVRAGALV